MVEQEEPDAYAGDGGATKLLNFLELKRFNKSAFRDLPRAFDEFFEETVFQRKGAEPMAAFCTAMEVSKAKLEAIDADTKISANELGYHTLRQSGLNKEEKKMVLGRAGETYAFDKAQSTLKNLFPSGGVHSRGAAQASGGKPFRPRRGANHIDGEDHEEDDYEA